MTEKKKGFAMTDVKLDVELLLTPDASINPAVANWSDEYFSEIIADLEDQGAVSEDPKITRMLIEVEPDEPLKVYGIEEMED